MPWSKQISSRARKRRVLTGCCVSLLALVFMTPAGARVPPPSDISGADAYRESVPTAAGARATGGRGAPAMLPEPIEQRLESDTRAQLLRDVATSPAFGAPGRDLRGDLGAPEQASDRSAAPSVPVAAEAVGNAFGEARLVVLALVLLALLVGAISIRVKQSR